MRTPRVWAPFAETLELETGGERLRMARGERDWWHCEEDTKLDHSVDYAFRVDGEGPFPDPRSPWQPNGVHGPSRWYDHGRFAWTDNGWNPPPLSSALIYEVHIGTFTPEGTFASATEKFGYLKELGVTHIQLMPVAEFSGNRGWGYDGADLYAPHHAYGGPDGLKAFVDAAHENTLAVLLDVVYNHPGPAGSYLNRFGPYYTDRCKTPWGEAANLDGPESDEVRRFFIDNTLMWLRDYHLDGLRLDAVHALIDTSATHFVAELVAEVRRLEAHAGRRFAMIAESDLNDPRLVQPQEIGGFGLDAQWNEDFHNALHATLTGERHAYYRDFGSLADVARALENGYVYDGRYSTYRRRRHGRPPTGVPGCRFIGFLQNHDQVGNRAQGERTSHLLTHGQLKIGAALTLTAPFVPMVFQGEEWGARTPFLFFTGYEDQELGATIREGRCQEFAGYGWDFESVPDPQSEATFQTSKLDWDEAARPEHADLLSWHRQLIALRGCFPQLTSGEMATVQYDEDRQWLTVRRGPLRIFCNFSDSEQGLPIEGSAGEIVLASDPAVSLRDAQVLLAGHSVVVIAAVA